MSSVAGTGGHQHGGAAVPQTWCPVRGCQTEVPFPALPGPYKREDTAFAAGGCVQPSEIMPEMGQGCFTKGSIALEGVSGAGIEL